MEAVQKHRGLYLFESILFILLGILAIAIPGLFTYSLELVIGILFLVGGVVQGYRACKAGKSSERPYSLFTALLGIVVGALLLFYPLTGVLTLTLLLAAFFLVDGIVTIALGLRVRPAQGWGWLLFSGIVSVVLAGIIWSNFPGSAVWVIGLLVGINLLIFGFSLLFLTLGTPKANT